MIYHQVSEFTYNTDPLALTYDLLAISPICMMYSIVAFTHTADTNTQSHEIII